MDATNVIAIPVVRNSIYGNGTDEPVEKLYNFGLYRDGTRDILVVHGYDEAVIDIDLVIQLGNSYIAPIRIEVNGHEVDVKVHDFKTLSCYIVHKGKSIEETNRSGIPTFNKYADYNALTEILSLPNINFISLSGDIFKIVTRDGVIGGVLEQDRMLLKYNTTAALNHLLWKKSHDLSKHVNKDSNGVTDMNGFFSWICNNIYKECGIGVYIDNSLELGRVSRQELAECTRVSSENGSSLKIHPFR